MSDRTPVPGETSIDRLDALIEAYEPGNYALADGVCHVYYDVPGSTATLYADLVELKRLADAGGSLAASLTEAVRMLEAALRSLGMNTDDNLRLQRIRTVLAKAKGSAP